MAALVPPPNQTTTLTSSGVFDSATLATNSTLAIDGTGVVVEILGALTGVGRVSVQDGGTFIVDGSVMSTPPSMFGGFLGFSIGTAGSLVLPPTAAGSSEGLGVNYTGIGTLKVGAQPVSLQDYASGDVLEFYSPAVSFTYTAPTPYPYHGGVLRPLGTLSVTKQDGTIATIQLSGAYSLFNSATFKVVNGTVINTPVASPTIAGAPSALSVNQASSIDPFASVVIADANADASRVTATVTTGGQLIDPNAATDGSSYNAGTGVFTVSGTAAGVTTVVQSLVFKPVQYTLNPGQTVPPRQPHRRGRLGRSPRWRRASWTPRSMRPATPGSATRIL